MQANDLKFERGEGRTRIFVCSSIAYDAHHSLA